MGRRAGVTAGQTRSQLLAATMTVLLRRGYDGTRVSEIAREADLTTGAIYNHFASKAELLTAAITEQGPGAISTLIGSGDAASVLDAFRQIGRVLPDGLNVLGPTMLELIAASTRDPQVAQVVGSEFANKERDSADMVRLGQDIGEVDPTLSPEALVRFTTMLALGSFAVAALDLKPIDHDAWGAVIDRMLRAATPQEDQP